MGFCHRCCLGLLIMNPGCCCCARKEIISWKMPVDTDLYDCCHVCKEGAIWEGYVMVFFPMQVQDLQQRKCTIMFELSCNLERILEFFTQELPQAFLQGPEMNLIRLCELIIFVLNHTTCSADALFFDRLYSYPHLSLPLLQKKTEEFWLQFVDKLPLKGESWTQRVYSSFLYIQSCERKGSFLL